MRPKFEADDKVQFKHTPFTKAVFWTVIVPEPDELGQIVIHNPRSNEYHIAHQTTLKRL